MITHNLAILTDEEPDEDDVVLGNIPAHNRAEKTFGPRPEHWTLWTDKKFFMRFKQTRPTVLELFNQVAGKIKTPTDQNDGVSPMNRFLFVFLLLYFVFHLVEYMIYWQLYEHTAYIRLTQVN